MKLAIPAVVLLGFLPLLATAQVAILHLQVVEGEGAVVAAGSRGARPLAVEVTDETGRPAAGAAVSFHLPEAGPGGTFGNGLRTDVVLTDARGRAAVRNLQVNRTPGRFQISIVASKEQAHAGLMTFQYIVDAKSAAGAASRGGSSISRGTLRWVVVGALAAGAAALGALAAGRAGNSASTTSTPTPAAAPSLAIGSPTLTIGKL